MHIVLFAPEIPQNTGNIARTCAAAGCDLTLVEPLGFSLSDKYLKRAGMDYFSMVEISVASDFGQVLRQFDGCSFYFATTKAPRAYSQVRYAPDDVLVFGSESRGLPENLLSRRYGDCVRIPMRQEARSLNLSNAVAIVLYEALRQGDFAGLSDHGALTGREEPPAPWLDYV